LSGWPREGRAVLAHRPPRRVEVAHRRLGQSRRLARSFERTETSVWLQVACDAAVIDALTRERPDVAARTYAHKVGMPARGSPAHNRGPWSRRVRPRNTSDRIGTMQHLGHWLRTWRREREPTSSYRISVAEPGYFGSTAPAQLDPTLKQG
jgi:hypothetical protein